MRKLLLTVAVTCSILLGGCATVGQPGGLDQIIAQVQSITRQACAFVPTAQTVANILAAGQLNGAFIIANAICAAVTASAPDARTAGRRVPTVSGVIVKGTFVRR